MVVSDRDGPYIEPLWLGPERPREHEREAGGRRPRGDRDGEGGPVAARYTVTRDMPRNARISASNPFLRESSLVVVPEDVHELQHDSTAIRGKEAHR
jgi:hypothetical protein